MICEIESQISGIPCMIRIDDFISVKPWKGPASSCPSDLDYYGYTEINWTVLDRKGYEAEWLRKKLTQDDECRIEAEIMEAHKQDQEYV